MRHKKSVNHLGRKTGHRKAMLSNMATSLILHKRITTTVAKAKALRQYVEPLITKSKEDSTHNRRVAFGYLQDKFAVAELFRDISVKVAKRPGGYTRILKTGNRLGDNAEMCMMELVDYNENLLALKEEKAGKSTRRRSRRGSGSKTTESKSTETTNTASALNEEQKVKDQGEVAEEKPVDVKPEEDAKIEKKPVESERSEEKPEDKKEPEGEVKTKEEDQVKGEAKEDQPEENKKKDDDSPEKKSEDK